MKRKPKLRPSYRLALAEAVRTYPRALVEYPTIGGNGWIRVRDYRGRQLALIAAWTDEAPT